MVTEPVTFGLPVRLKIPAINIDAASFYVGLGLDGRHGYPKDPNDAAWFNIGPRPGGENGSSVIAGTMAGKMTYRRYLDNLSKLAKRRQDLRCKTYQGRVLLLRDGM